MKLDPEVEPSFQTYTEVFDTECGGNTEVWVCKSAAIFGVEQGEDIIVLSLAELLTLQRIVNEAVEIAEAQDE